MSLSKEILEGTREKVEAFLAQGAPLDETDEYGYTPLIHAVVLRKTDIIRLLLKHHADPNAGDLSGTTALHWAVDIDDLDIAKLLLDAGANPNAYSGYGQPVLFYPYLRKNKALVQLLLDKGADLTYTKDYTLAKLIGHRFEIQGSADLVTPERLFIPVDLEGFYLEFTLDLTQESLRRFMQSYEGHRIERHDNELNKIIQTLDHAIQLRAYKHFNIDHTKHYAAIHALLDIKPLLLPVSYKSHAITFIRYDNLFAACDRGVHRMTDPIKIYEIGHPENLTDEFYTHLLYHTRHTDQFIKHDVPHKLGLIPFAKLPIKHQITGNCSWANVEASVPTMLYMMLHKTNDIKSIMQFYRAWLEWDKDRAIEDWLSDFDEANFQRQKSKAALLGAILFQSCRIDSPRDIARAKKILALLSKREFHYIIKTYADVFVRGGQSAEGQAFKALVEKCGYKLTDFK